MSTAVNWSGDESSRQKKTTDLFLYGKVRPRRRESLNPKELESYVLLKARISGGMCRKSAVTEVARVLGVQRGTTYSCMQRIELKGWL